MKVVRGRVVGNTVVIEAAGLPEGAEVSVLLDAEGWDIDEASREEQRAARRSIEAGRGAAAEEVLEALGARRRP